MATRWTFASSVSAPSTAEVILNARVVGGFDVDDNGEADDKIIAVLENDMVYGAAQDINDIPPVIIERLSHYFSTYKLVPGEAAKLTIQRTYDGACHASG